MIENIKKGNIYSYKNHLYKVEDLAKFKNPITRIWEDAVIYSRSNPSEAENKELYVRSADDFASKFEHINHQ